MIIQKDQNAYPCGLRSTGPLPRAKLGASPAQCGIHEITAIALTACATVSRFERLVIQEALNQRPELVQLLAALLDSLEVTYEAFRRLQATHQPCARLRASRSDHSLRSSSSSAWRMASRVSGFGTSRQAAAQSHRPARARHDLRDEDGRANRRIRETLA